MKEREKQKLLRDAEELRLKREMAERERQRAQQEHENIRKKEAEKRIEQLKTTDIGIRALEGLTEEVTITFSLSVVLVEGCCFHAYSIFICNDVHDNVYSKLLLVYNHIRINSLTVQRSLSPLLRFSMI